MPAAARPPAAPPAEVAAFFASVGEPTQWFQLFEHLPRVYLFVKDLAGRFMKVNTSCALLHGCRHEREMLGRTDFDFHPPALAAQYVEEDRRVIRSGRPLADQVWLVLGHDRMPRWYLSTKMPVLDPAGEPVGLAGVLRPYDHTGASPAAYNRLTPAMEHVVGHYGERIELRLLAERAHLSVSQLQREFRRLFGQTPGEYLLRVRLLMARRRLEETDDPFGLIALECGFYDQSHFNRAFRAHVGMPPGGYRRRFRRGWPGTARGAAAEAQAAVAASGDEGAKPGRAAGWRRLRGASRAARSPSASDSGKGRRRLSEPGRR